MTGTNRLAEFIKHGNDLQKDQLTAKQEDAFNSLSTFLAKADELPVQQQLAALDGLIRFADSPVSLSPDAGSQLALGAGPSQGRDPNEVLAEALYNSKLPDSVKHAIRRLTTDKNDSSHIAVDDNGTPVEITELRKKNDELNRNKLSASSEQTNATSELTRERNEAIRQRDEAVRELDELKRNSPKAVADELIKLLGNAKEPGIKDTLAPKKFRTLPVADIEKATGLLEVLSNPDKAAGSTPTKQLPKAGH